MAISGVAGAIAPILASDTRVTVEEMTEFGYQVEVAAGYDEAVIRTRLAMRGEGFSILTEMHVGGLLGPEAGDERQYLIMAVWNAQLGARRIGPDLSVGVHLPCNVVIQERGSSALVAALDPSDVVAEEAEATPEITAAAREALGRVLTRIAAAA